MLIHRIQLLALLLFIGLIACNTDDNKTNPTQPGEQLYVNAKIYTVNEAMEWADAMLVKDGIIISIGSRSDVEKQATEEVEIIDLKNSMVMPGIHDVHMHPLEASSENFQFSLNVDETDPENYKSDIRKAVNQNSKSTWIIGWGFELHTLLDANRTPVEILDEVSTTKPIVVMEQTSHAVWVNSKALELAGIDKNTPNPTGGIIMKDDQGSPNGLLIDNAGNLIIDLAISTIPNSAQNDYEGLVYFGLPELAKHGITSICDARTYWKRNHHETWKKIESDGKLTVRVNLGLWLYPTEDDDAQINTLKAMYSFDSSRLLRINQIKLYADGIVSNTTSAMKSDFLIDLFKLSTNNGLNYVTQNRIAKYISALEPDGFDFHIHTIGDRGVNEALNAIEQSGTAQGRHRLTHVEYVSPSDYPRFAQLNVTADAQVAGDFAQPDHWHENDNLVNASLNDAIIPIKDLVDANARVALSSDWDVSDLNPFIGIQNAVTRSPQNISLSEAIKSYTIHAAYVMRQESQVGSLEVGKEADFIVLNQNLFDINPTRIGQTLVLETYLKGRRVYKR
jgi:predicted amidohydrolase YtcJ